MAGNTAAPRAISSSQPKDVKYSFSDNPETDLSAVTDSVAVDFNLRSNCHRDWTPRDAFLELVQHWRESIMHTFELTEEGFPVLREEKTGIGSYEVIYKVRAPPRGPHDLGDEWAGYIHFQGTQSKGKVTIANRCGKLDWWYFDICATRKKDNSAPPENSSDRLKVAILALARGRVNQHIRCKSDGFRWSFGFAAHRRLGAHLQRMLPEEIRMAGNMASPPHEGSLIPFEANPNHDTQFIIGEVNPTLDKRGLREFGSGVTLKEFERWTKGALFLNQARLEPMVSVEHGDLLLHQDLRGYVYLDSFLLREPDSIRSEIREYRFGYNLMPGGEPRYGERCFDMGSDEEARSIFRIWEQVLSSRPNMVRELSVLLRLPCLDALAIRRHAGWDLARQLQQHLFQDGRKWYYCNGDMALNPSLEEIIQGIGREGAELPALYWDLLRSYDLVLTAEEEECRRFQVASVVEIADLDSPFATSVHRLLRGCVHACAETEGISVAFVQAGQLRLQAYYSEYEQLLRVHVGWLSVCRAREELGITDDLTEADLIFHTVKRLFSDTLEQVTIEPGTDRSCTAAQHMRATLSNVEQNLLAYLRLADLSIDAVSESPKLHLRWQVDPNHNPSTDIEIQCHQASRCSHLRASLLTADDARTDSMACLNNNASQQLCRTSRVSVTAGEHLESRLKEGEEYFFVLLTPKNPKSFVRLSGFATAARRPWKLRNSRTYALHDRTEEAGVTNPTPAASTLTGPFALGSPLHQLDLFKVEKGQWYEACSSDNVKAVIGILMGGKAAAESSSARTKKRRRTDQGV